VLFHLVDHPVTWVLLLLLASTVWSPAGTGWFSSFFSSVLGALDFFDCSPVLPFTLGFFFLQDFFGYRSFGVWFSACHDSSFNCFSFASLF
jgi:hypothetical protein